MLDAATSNCPTHNPAGSTRRGFLRAGSLGLAGLSLPAATRAETRGDAARRASPRGRSAILVFLGGGLSHVDTFDPKPDAPADVRGTYAPIRTAVPGLTIGEKLPRLAALTDRFALVRSLSHASDHHETAANWVLSGRAGSAFGDHPAVGAVVAHETGFAGPVPPYVAVPRNPSFTWELGKSAYLGGRCESLSECRAGEAALSPEARRAFAVEREPEGVRNRYGRTEVGRSMLLARRLVEGGVRFVTVSCGGWDHHARIHESLDRQLPAFDRALTALLEDLAARGLLAETLLVVVSEFGRTPKLNRDGGRDHWGRAGSLLLAGAGVRGGAVLGRTDRLGAFPAERPVSPADVAFTVFDALGIDPRKPLPGPGGRPVAVLDSGESLKELFA
jgi:uncharacterized protein (DUF1501 family)